MDSREGGMSVLMLPFLAHGHISPFFELARELTKRKCNIFLCSSPINLDSIKNRISGKESISMQLVELHLPSLPDLPPHYHTTNGLPPHLIPKLQHAFDMASSSFSNILKTLNPDLLIYDFNPRWAAQIASSHNIPAVYFLTTAAASASLAFHFSKSPSEKFPFPEIYVHNHNMRELSADVVKNLDDLIACMKRSCNIILIKSLKELEGKYIDHLSVVAEKTMIPVGPLVQDPPIDKDDEHIEIKRWLDKRDKSSVVFVCFGSEHFPSNEELEEVAHGLELSQVSFLWAVRFPKGELEKRSVEEALPEGFLQRVGERGMVVEGWAPQDKILGHSSTGGFVSHCGWSSLMESMKFGVPIIAMAMHLDQPINAKLVVEAGVGVEVVKDKSGRFNREEIAEIIRKVVVEESGEFVRRETRALSERMREKGEEEIDRAVEELVKLCRKKKETC